MNDLPLATCPYCQVQTNQRLMPESINIINKDPRTLGSLAEKNKKELGRYGYEKQLHDLKEQRRKATEFRGKLPDGAYNIPKPDPVRPWYRPERDTPDLSLNKLTPEQKTKFIMEGKTPL